MNYYVIADTNLCISTTERGILEKNKDFEVSHVINPDLSVNVERVGSIPKTEGQLALNENIIWSNSNGQEYPNNISLIQNDIVVTSLDANEDWSKGRVRYLLNDNEWEWKRTNALFEILFRNNIIFHDGIVLHASAIKWQDKAIVFSAPAGTGKTTQTNLWKQYMQARVLNGDRPAMRIIEDQVFIYGTPWSGSSPDFINEKAPAEAIVIVEQAQENKTISLNPIEAISRIMPRFFLPYNDKKMMDLAMKTIEKILQRVPVYLLRCKPDKGAVDALYSVIR